MNIYLAGPMRGYEQYNFPAFDAAKENLRKQGFKVTCPAEMDIVDGFNPNEEMTTKGVNTAFRRDVLTLLECDAIAMLPNWEISTGANAELALAEMLGLKTFEYDKNSTPNLIPFVSHYNYEKGGDRRFIGLTVEMCKLHAKKQNDYGLEGDPFSNVRASEAFGIPGWVGTLMRGQDKMKRLQKAAQGGTLSNESVEDSLIDLANYAIIALILYRELEQ